MSDPGIDPDGPGKLKARSESFEKAILSCLLNDLDGTLPGVAQTEIVHPGAFYEPKRRAVYMIACDLWSEQRPISVATVADRLGKTRAQGLLDRGKMADRAHDRDGDRAMRSALRISSPEDAEDYTALEMVGGFEYLIELAGFFASKGAFRETCCSLWQLYVRRKLSAAIHRRIGELDQGVDELPDWIEQTQALLIRTGNRMESDGIESLGRVIERSRKAIGKIESGEARPGCKTGIHMLDSVLGTLRRGSLNILAARPGVGKTSFALYILGEISQLYGERCLFMSMEVPAEHIAYKLASRLSGADFRSIESGTVPDRQKRSVDDAFAELEGWKVDIDYGRKQTIDQLRAKIIRYRSEHPDLAVVFVDYLQLIFGSHPAMREYEKVTEVSNELAALAATIDTPIVALSQLSREEKGAKPRAPTLRDLRGSGSLEQDAATVTFLHEISKHTDRRELLLRVAKNRFGPQMDLGADFYPTTGRYEVRSLHRKDGGSDDASRDHSAPSYVRDDEPDDETLYPSW